MHQQFREKTVGQETSFFSLNIWWNLNMLRGTLKELDGPMFRRFGSVHSLCSRILTVL